MGTFLYVGNLGRETTEDQVREAFVAAGFEVESVTILRSPQNDRSRGFGYDGVGSEELAAAAVGRMNGVELQGRKLTVSPARERAPNLRAIESFGARSSGGARRPGGGGRRKAR